jgi:hypothetical protein
MGKEDLPGEHMEPQRRRGSLRQLTRSEQIIAALIGLVGVVLAAILPIVLSNGSSSSSTPTPTIPQPSSLGAAATLPPEQVLQDDTRVISLLVPDNWDSIRTNGWYPNGLPPFANGTNIGPGLNAATNASAWFSDLTTSGIFVGASRRLVAAHYTPSKLLRQISFNHCVFSSSQGYATGKWTGAQEIWSCTHSSTRWLTIAMWPHDHSYIVYVQIKIVTPLDQRIGNKALASLSVSF